MLHSKLLKKYLAGFVCCLVLLMSISTLLLAYSFHIHRSPLIVQALGFGEKERPKQDRVSQTSDESHIFPKERAPEDRFTTILNKQENFPQASTEIYSFDVRKKSDEFSNIKYDKFEITTNSEKPDTNLENLTLTDTIYIDDFERSKTIHHTSQETDLNEENQKISSAVNKSSEKVESSNLPSQTKKIKSVLKYNKNLKRKNKKSRKGKSSANNEAGVIEIEEANRNRHIKSSLDAPYDNQINKYPTVLSTSEKLNDDTEDDYSVHGSGSGDFPITDDTEQDEFPYYDNFVVQHFSADWIDDDNRLIRTSFNGQQNLAPNRSTSRKAQKRLKSNERKTLPKSFDNISQSSNSQSSNLFESNKMLQRNEALETMANESTKSSRKKQNKAKKNRKVRVGPLHDSTQRPSQPPEKLTQEQYKSPDDFWLETRTRRIMGNVKKSEERSRQLLLCEEAGGGELCRMLFKGHISE